MLWPVADAMRGRKVDMHFARAAKMSRSSRLVDAPPMLVPSADQHRVPTCSVSDGSTGHRRLASCRSPRHCRLSTSPSSCDGGVERLLFAFPSGGVSQRARLYNSDALCDDGGPGAKYADCSTAPTAPTARATASSARASARVRAPLRAAKSTRAASRARAAPSARSSARASLARALARAARRLASTVLPRWAQRLCVRPRKQLTA